MAGPSHYKSERGSAVDNGLPREGRNLSCFGIITSDHSAFLFAVVEKRLARVPPLLILS